MRKPFFCLVLVCAAIVILGGCRTATIHNVTDASIPNAVDHQLTLDEVTKAIVSAGAKHGWEMRIQEPGHIVGTLGLRSHVAVVDIPYTTKSFSIVYKSSENLRYDPDDKTIHSNYNGWIRNLHVAIQRNLGGSGQPN